MKGHACVVRVCSSLFYIDLVNRINHFFCEISDDKCTLLPEFPFMALKKFRLVIYDELSEVLREKK